MKQIAICLDRFFEKKQPLKTKWQAVLHPEDENLLLIFHYHHLIIVYRLNEKKCVYQWWEKQADKRGLEASLAYLEQKFKK